MGILIPKKIVAFDTWQDGIAIPSGYSVFIHFREGSWNINPGKHTQQSYGPEGSNVVATDDKYPLTGEKEGCLIGRVLYDGKPNENGSIELKFDWLKEEGNKVENTIFTIGRDGLLIPKSMFPKILELRCNDIDNGVFDNVGELQLELEIW